MLRGLSRRIGRGWNLRAYIKAVRREQKIHHATVENGDAITGRDFEQFDPEVKTAHEEGSENRNLSGVWWGYLSCRARQILTGVLLYPRD